MRSKSVMQHFAVLGAFYLLMVLSLPVTNAVAEGRRTADEVIALVERAIAHYDAVGQEQAWADFNDVNGEFVDGELYVLVYNTDGIHLVHPHNSALIHNTVALDVVDVNGVSPSEQIRSAATSTPDGGWAEYVWVNPENEALETKHLYVVVHDGYWFAVGYYLPNDS